MIDTDVSGAEPDAAENAPGDPEIEDESTIEGDEDKLPGKKSRRLQLSVSIRGLVNAVVIVVLVGAVGVLGWLYVGANRKLDDTVRQSENKAHAESVALHYAVEAAAMNYEDLDAWKAKLVAGTSPELKEKLTKAAKSMEQILVPLQWNSTARPLAAKVRSVTGGTYVVDSFVSVLTKTAQAPEPLQSTATYSVTIDSTKDWQITDVGGVGDALGEK
jgi:Mce-associated membrane protein